MSAPLCSPSAPRGARASRGPRGSALAALSCLALGAACDSGAPPEAAVDPRPPTPATWDRDVTRRPEVEAAASRASCTYRPGALPAETLGAEIPVGKDLPIDTIVVLMQENRSFDHYFGHFGRYAGRTDVTAAPEDASNPERSGPASSARHAWQHAPHHCFLDTAHSWQANRTQLADGRMDGFFEASHEVKGEVLPDPTAALKSGERAMWWYDERDIPYYYALAKAFALGDHYFASVLGPTWPNRMYLFAGTSFGLGANTFPDVSHLPFPERDAVVLDQLDRRRVDWIFYTAGGPPGVSAILAPQLHTRWGRDVVRPIDELYADAAAGRLPPVVFVDPNFLRTGDPEGNDEHPPSHLQVGQRFVAGVLSALMKGPQWGRMAIFLTYDEHGGLYDHLAPPPACPPDDARPRDKSGAPLDGAFDRYGFRVPLLVVSPWVKRGHVSHAVLDHTSLLRFIQARHGLPALTARDANAMIPLDFFDFARTPDASIPALPEPAVDDGELTYCKATFARGR